MLRSRGCPGLPGAGRQEPTFVTDHVIISGNMGPKKQTIPGTALYPYGRHFIVVGYILEGNLTLLRHSLTLDVVMALLELGTPVS